jgi:hypothetical protein
MPHIHREMHHVAPPPKRERGREGEGRQRRRSLLAGGRRHQIC